MSLQLHSPKIAIIGAGVSGLAAAVQLANAGVSSITLLEARRTAGGRTRSYLDAASGDTLDNGQHLLMGCYAATLEYLDTIGTAKLVQHEPLRIPFWSSTGVRSFTIDRTLGPPLNLLTALARTSLLTLAEKRAAGSFGKAIWLKRLPKQLAEMTCQALFDAFDQPPTLCEKLWSPIVLATINARPEEASAVLFVNVLREAFFSSRQASMLLVPQCGLSELLINPALRKLEAAGVEIKLGAPVRSIECGEAQIVLQTDSDKVLYDFVINSTNDTLNPTPYTLTPSPIVNAYFWLDRIVLSAPAYAFVGMTLQWAFPKASTFSAQRLALTVSAANDLVEQSNDEITELLWSDLQRTVPAAREATLVRSQIIREKQATPLFTPATQQVRPHTNTDDKRFILAGDLVQNGLPATIEGAIRNGNAAAELLQRRIAAHKR